MRLGAPVYGDTSTPEAWAAAVRVKGYSAAFCPPVDAADDDMVAACARAAEEADIVIAEVGAWSNPLSRDEDERRRAIEKCCAGLDLADRIGARCCVNISGSRSGKWDGPHPDNLSDETFEMIVTSVREIIDAVQPARTYYTLETMPWVPPHSPQSYLDLIEAVDRDRFGVHLDPVNLVNSPERYFDTTGLLRECFAKLGPWIRSCHAKDIVLDERLTVHLSEAAPGEGALDYATYLRELDALGADVPLLIEHLPDEESYDKAAAHIRSVAAAEGVEII
ncbi:MAG: sugar phosphate isomerase/epimerase [Armatimonadetes bacterium]|nr:sugar phosphate isomerase/epimerase [Armatimonadota bacterium]